MVTTWQLQDGRFIITTSNRICNPSHALTERNTRGAAMRDTGQLSQLRPLFQKARVVFQSKEVHSQWTRVKNSLRDRLLPDLAAKLHFQQQRLHRLRWQNWKGSSLTEAPLTRMQEVVPPLWAPVEGLTLGDFVLVVRKSQVYAARVDIQPTPKHQAARHGAEQGADQANSRAPSHSLSPLQPRSAYAENGAQF